MIAPSTSKFGIRLDAALLVVPLLLSAAAARCQIAATDLPAGTPLVVRLLDNLPMHSGLPVHAELIYPVYSNNQIALPAKCLLNGTVVSLRPDRVRRTRARLGGDFTPFHIPVVRFTELVLPGGVPIAIATSTATDGAPMFRAVAPPPVRGGIVRQGIDAGLTAARSDLALFTSPGRADRLTQFVYNRLPYHPERIEKATAWTTQVESPISLPAQPLLPTAPAAAASTPSRRRFWQQPIPVEAIPGDTPGRWIIQAYLDQPLSSETSKAGQPVKATVADPILNPDGTVAIPQGAILEGTVAKAEPARRFGRSGTLSFNFRELTLPGAAPQNVETTLTGADSAPGLALNSEGQVKSKPQDKLSLPIFLAILASQPLDGEEAKAGGTKESGLGKNAVGGAAGLGLLGTIIGLAGASPNAAAGIGYYGAALAVYDRWIARGRIVSFPLNTRMVVQTVARRSAAIHADPPGSADTPPPR